MGTRSYIAQQTATGIIAVYCHWDGYPSHNGRILRDHYSNTEKLAQLIAHGDMSILGPEIGSQHEFRACPDGECTFFHRDRGDKWEHVKPQTCMTIRTLLKRAERCGAEYVYLHDGETWHYAVRGLQCFGLSNRHPFSEMRPLPDLEEDA